MNCGRDLSSIVAIWLEGSGQTAGQNSIVKPDGKHH